ncbi:hypothetical protein AHF37_03201 [Paragonimus kellicotti]|nr:hypothetical protein AHF37_03201 [Paragonimus kellicotti]
MVHLIRLRFPLVTEFHMSVFLGVMHPLRRQNFQRRGPVETVSSQNPLSIFGQGNKTSARGSTHPYLDVDLAGFKPAHIHVAANALESPYIDGYAVPTRSSYLLHSDLQVGGGALIDV